MNDIQKELDQAYKLLSSISVQGDGVDVMFAVRERLRKAFALAADKEVEDNG